MPKALKANDLTRAIILFLHQQGSFAFRVNDTGVYDIKRGLMRTASKKGISDVLAVYNSVFIGIEVKIGSDKLRPEQIGFIKNVEHCRGKCFVARDFLSFQQDFLDWKSSLPHN